MNELVPILYSFRRCPYAIRARMALYLAGINVRIREVKLSNKPKQLLAASPKGTVPVIVLPDGTVINESLDIMRWAMDQAGIALSWLPVERQSEIDSLIRQNDREFKPLLDAYKYPQSSEKKDPLFYRRQGEIFLQALDHKLSKHQYLFGESASLADIAIMPFIRQFRGVDAHWFDQCHYHSLNRWLAHYLESKAFLEVMTRYSPWNTSDEAPTLF